jgi:hypothetical protein
LAQQKDLSVNLNQKTHFFSSTSNFAFCPPLSLVLSGVLRTAQFSLPQWEDKAGLGLFRHQTPNALTLFPLAAPCNNQLMMLAV